MQLLIDILYKKSNRTNLIKEFQEQIWNNEYPFKNEYEEEVLRELAYDLDYFEPKEEWRAEDCSLYGDEKLEKEIKEVLKKLEFEHNDL